MKYARAHVFVKGDVRDFAFKYFTRQKSAILDLNGWVRHLSDGEVEMVIEGLEDDVNKMVEWCKKGPSIIKENIVRAEFSDYVGEFEGFEIRS